MTDTGRLSPQQWQAAHDRAFDFRDQLLTWADDKATGNTVFYPELFRIAAELIEKDTDAFCDRAQEMFDEIDAYGQEPTLDDDWLDEVTGEKDSFYFSTDSLVTHLPPLPELKRDREPKPPSENDVIKAVQEAVAQVEDVLAVAHHENPNAWIQRIATALRDNGGVSDFGIPRQTTNLSPGALFLGLLLGHDNWQLTQKAFYGDVTVSLTAQGG